MKKTLLPLILLAALSSCYNDKAELLYPTNACNTDTVTYSKVVGPILMVNCASADGCHKTAHAPTSGGVSLDNYAGAKVVADNGKLVGVITHTPGFSQMPKNLPKLDDCSIAKITKWVNAGAPNN
jgi:hypothetical protein